MKPEGSLPCEQGSSYPTKLYDIFRYVIQQDDLSPL